MTEILITDWLTAIGTIAAVIVALIISILQNILKWIKRPMFELGFENEEPFCRHAALEVEPGKFKDCYWVRLKVWNKGGSVAKNCEGKLVRITDAKTNKDRTDFDPVVLNWVGSTHNPIDINKSEFEYLDILFVRSDRPDIINVTPRPEEAYPRGINLSPSMQNYIFHITIYGENVEPYSKSYYFHSNSRFDQVKLREFEDESRRKRKGYPFIVSFMIAGLIFVIAVCSDFAVKMFYTSEIFWLKIVVSLLAVLFMAFLIHIMLIFPFFRKALSRMFGLEGE